MSYTHIGDHETEQDNGCGLRGEKKNKEEKGVVKIDKEVDEIENGWLKSKTGLLNSKKTRLINTKTCC